MSCRPGGEREPRRRESRAVASRRPVAVRRAAVDRQAPLTRVVDDDVVPAARAVERHADHPGAAAAVGRRREIQATSRRARPAASCAARAPTAAPAHPGPRSRAVRSRRRRRPSSRNPRRARSARAHRRPRPRAPRGWPGATARRAPARAAPRCAPAPRARTARRSARARVRADLVIERVQACRGDRRELRPRRRRPPWRPSAVSTAA